MMQPKMLIVGDFACGTGFSAVVEAFSRCFSNYYEIAVVGLYCPDSTGSLGFPFRVFPAAKANGDAFGVETLKAAVVAAVPDVVFCINDAMVVHKWYKAIEETCQAQSVEEPTYCCYCPIDGDIFIPEVYHHLISKGYFVSYTEFGVNKIMEAFIRYDLPKNVINDKLLVVPHYVDPATFYPIERKHAREEFSKLYANKYGFPSANQIIADEHFVIGWVNRNQPRKWLSKAIEASSIILKKYPKARLLIRASMNDIGGDHIPYIRNTGTALQTILIEPFSKFGGGLSLPELNLLYNTFDIFISTSLTEGWGLTEHEAASCGKALILPDNSVRRGLWQGAAELVPCPVAVSMPGMCMSTGHLVDANLLASALERHIINPDLTEALGRACYARVKSLANWEASAAKIHEMIKKSVKNLVNVNQ